MTTKKRCMQIMEDIENMIQADNAQGVLEYMQRFTNEDHPSELGAVKFMTENYEPVREQYLKLTSDYYNALNRHNIDEENM